MSKGFLIGFIVIAGVAVGAVDYINQARRAGSKPGAFGVSDYVSTISGRFRDQQATMAAAADRSELLAMEPRSFLPEAPQGWTRGDWRLETDLGFIRLGLGEGEPTRRLRERVEAEERKVRAFYEFNKNVLVRKNGAEVYVYDKPGATIQIRVSVRRDRATLDPIAAAVQQPAMDLAAGNIEAMSGKDGFAVIRGVTYREEFGLFGMQAEERAYRVFSASLGDRVAISVKANAADADIVALLDGIDYDRLNQMLDAPLPGVGSAAAKLTAEESLALAREQVAAAAKAQAEKAAANQRQLLLNALEIEYRHGRMAEADYEAEKARLMAAPALPATEAALDAAAPMQEAASGQAAPEPAAPAKGGGILGMLGGMFGGKTEETAEAAPPPAAAPKSEVRVNGLGSNCTITNGVKRCSLNGG